MKQLTVSFLVVMLVFLSGCADDDTPMSMGDGESEIILTLYHNVGDEKLILFKDYSDSTGRKFNVTTVRYYISNLRLIRRDLSEKAIEDYLLVNPENSNTYNLGAIAAGSFMGVKFDIGVGPTKNSISPAQYETGHPLALQQDVSMHYGLESRGYMFMRLEGEVDTSVNINGAVDYPWSFKIGSDALLRTVTIDQNFEIQQGVDINLNVLLDVKKLIEAVNLKHENSTDSFGPTGFIAIKIANNIEEAFSLLKAE